MPVISFQVTAEQRAEAQEYALRKGYGRASNLARVAMIQMMSRYPLTGRRAPDGSKDGNEGKDGRDVLPDAQAATRREGLA